MELNSAAVVSKPSEIEVGPAKLVNDNIDEVKSTGGKVNE